MNIDMTLTIKRQASYLTWEQWLHPLPDYFFRHQTLEPGTKVGYLGHYPGGAVKVRHGDKFLMISPADTEELA